MDERGRPPDQERPAVRLFDAALSAATTAMRSALGTSEHGKGRHRPVALVLSGGVGLGAYAKLDEAGGWRPDWIAGSSLGAVNAALIAGGPLETGVERHHLG